MPPTLAIHFTSAAAANRLVAQVPAAVRALATLARSGDKGMEARVLVAVPGGWQPSAFCMAEAQRLVPQLSWHAVDADRIDADGVAALHWISGAEHQGPGIPDPLAVPAIPTLSQEAEGQALALAARRIISATGKPGDGIVSRHLNRPVSQAITRMVLRWPAARPLHATLLAGVIGIAMAALLVMGGGAGLLAGATLFQLASIIDGVDGEMARATFRSSASGAMLDSVTDALTNLAFIGGVSFNVYAAGLQTAGIAGAAGCALLALGSAILALQSRRDGGNFTFDALKHRINARPSTLRQWLTWMTMRDFYAFAAFLAIILGAVVPLLYTFAVVAAGWLAVLLWVMLRSRDPE